MNKISGLEYFLLKKNLVKRSYAMKYEIILIIISYKLARLKEWSENNGLNVLI